MTWGLKHTYRSTLKKRLKKLPYLGIWERICSRSFQFVFLRAGMTEGCSCVTMSRKNKAQLELRNSNNNNRKYTKETVKTCSLKQTFLGFNFTSSKCYLYIWKKKPQLYTGRNNTSKVNTLDLRLPQITAALGMKIILLPRLFMLEVEVTTE